MMFKLCIATPIFSKDLAVKINPILRIIHKLSPFVIAVTILTVWVATSTPVWASLTASAALGSTGAKVPVGQAIDVMYVTVTSTFGDTNLTQLRFKNTSAGVNFGPNSITKASLYKATQSGLFTGTETQLANIPYPSQVSRGLDQNFNFSDTVTSGNSNTYIIVYTFSETAELNTSTNATLVALSPAASRPTRT